MDFPRSVPKGAGQDAFWSKKHILQIELREITIPPWVQEDSIVLSGFFGML